MDELAKAKWFSTLDLNSGYYQIRLKKGEEFKLPFKLILGTLNSKLWHLVYVEPLTPSKEL
jgi:hypothetical protein